MHGKTVSRSFTIASYTAAIAVAVAASLTASGAEDPENYTISGFKFFSASPGETNVYSGVLSGTGYAIVEGGGTVAFSNPNNTYSGGTLVSNAVFRLDADGCAGSGAITAAVNTAHIFMNCANVPNNLYFAAGYSSDKTTLKIGEYPPANAIPLFPLVSSVTVSGTVYFNAAAKYIPGSSNISDARTVTFENDVTAASGKEISIYTYGTTIFGGRLKEGSTGNNIVIGGAYSAKGSVVFNSSSNSVQKIVTYNANFTFNARDVLPETLFYFRYGGNGFSIFDFNGNDQTFAGVLWSYGDSHPSPPENDSGLRFRTTEGHPATVRLTGSNTYTPSGGTTPYKNRLALSGPLTLVMDILPASTSGGFYQEFSVRKSETTGDLVISNGDFRVTEGASFPNVPNIYVGTNGTFSSAGTTNAFAGCTSLVLDGTMTFADDVKTPFAFGKVALTLGASAHLTLPLGSTVTLASLKVGDEILPEGTYGEGGISVGQIEQGTVVVRSHDRYVDCENGSDGNDGSSAHPYKTIRAATTNAVSGDVIHVAPGTYGAAEGAEKYLSTASSLCRVIIPANVTVESTDGAENTFIVGAPSTDAEANGQGNGPGGVRCVYARNGAVLRGFTLTGGHTETTHSNATSSYDDYGAAVLVPSNAGATIEDCMISNNYSHYATLFRCTVRRCRIIGNIGGTASGTGADAPAGSTCRYIGCIIDGNRGNATVSYATCVESCTFGKNLMHNNGSAQVLSHSGGTHRVLNSLFTYGSDRWYGAVYATNCIFAAKTSANLAAENCSNCLFNTSVSLTDYTPDLGSVAIDSGDNALASFDLAREKDILGTPRVLNAQIDIGAVEYDWRPKFSTELGRRFAVTYASPSVTTNASGGLVMDGGQGASDLPCVAGTVPNAGSYELAFSLTGGSLAVYVGDALVKESSGTGDQLVAFRVSNVTQEIRFVFTPDASGTPGAAVLKQFVCGRGFSVIFR